MFYTKQLLHLHIFSVILIVFFYIFKEIILMLMYMVDRAVRSVSLGCIFAGTVFAASTAVLPLNPQVVADVSVQDPIDSLANEASAAQATAEAKITAQEQQDLNQASK